MNIFLTSSDPVECAVALDDKRVNKMLLETAQLLSGACRLVMPSTSDGIYKLSHKNHPCSVWTRASLHNFLWLYDHGIALCDEYELRFGRRHKSKDVIELAYQHLPVFGSCFEDKPLSFSFDSSGWVLGDVFYNYKMCLLHKWLSLDTLKPRWTYRGKPSWCSEFSSIYKDL